MSESVESNLDFRVGDTIDFGAGIDASWLAEEVEFTQTRMDVVLIRDASAV